MAQTARHAVAPNGQSGAPAPGLSSASLLAQWSSENLDEAKALPEVILAPKHRPASGRRSSSSYALFRSISRSSKNQLPLPMIDNESNQSSSEKNAESPSGQKTPVQRSQSSSAAEADSEKWSPRDDHQFNNSSPVLSLGHSRYRRRSEFDIMQHASVTKATTLTLHHEDLESLQISTASNDQTSSSVQEEISQSDPSFPVEMPRVSIAQGSPATRSLSMDNVAEQSAPLLSVFNPKYQLAYRTHSNPQMGQPFVHEEELEVPNWYADMQAEHQTRGLGDWFNDDSLNAMKSPEPRIRRIRQSSPDVLGIHKAGIANVVPSSPSTARKLGEEEETELVASTRLPSRQQPPRRFFTRKKKNIESFTVARNTSMQKLGRFIIKPPTKPVGNGLHASISPSISNEKITESAEFETEINADALDSCVDTAV